MTKTTQPDLDRDAMSQAYHDLWNDDIQAKIDADIEKHRKADATWAIDGVQAGDRVQVEQISHSFVFGAHIFNYDQLGADERNEKYKALYGDLFNSATIAFYWKTLEPVEGHPRYDGEFRDTAAFWNACKDPKNEPHWRRPAPGPVVDFCRSKGIRLHGHPLVWGSNKSMYPRWVFDHLPAEWRDRVPATTPDPRDNGVRALFTDYSADEIDKLLPGFASTFLGLYVKRIAEIARRYGDKIARRYGDKIDSWDVCNESAIDYERGALGPDAPLCKSHYGLMPGDYAYRAFQIADALLPKSAKLNINDYYHSQCYADQIEDLRARGCKIDIVGEQMHLFNPQDCLDIADGKTLLQSPALVREAMDCISRPGLPLHLSEITITAPGNDARGQAIQAHILRNLYRLWFSTEKMMGITWWNVVDDCGAAGEPSVSGLFSRDMAPKPSYFALDDLVNHEWRTNLTVEAGADGTVSFRGFRGTYRVTLADGRVIEKTLR